MNAFAVVSLVMLAFPALIAISSIWRGYVLSVVWGWFAVPVFGAPVLNIPSAIGVSLIVGFLTYHYQESGKSEGEEVGAKFAAAVLRALLLPAITLLVGWIVKQFM